MKTLTAIIAALTFASAAHAGTERHAMYNCARGHVKSCIHRAAIHWKVSYPYLVSVAFCESRFDPGATNGQYVGLFQFGANAWGRAHYSSHSPFSAKWASLGAAYMFHIGHSSEWECA